MPNVQAVLFDYGMVLSQPPDPAAWQQMQQLLGVTADELERGYWQFRDAYDRGALSGVAYWHAVAQSMARPLDEPILHALLDADTALWTRPNEPMIAWAQSLQRAGVPTGILSNLGDAMEAGLFARLPWLHSFQHHTFSHRLGIAKPDLAIYRHAAAGLSVEPEAILFIDDRAENVAAARAADMLAIRYLPSSTGSFDDSFAKFATSLREAGLQHWLVLPR
jgi:putative hydrolase of the HAD superfamily